ncbi:hypothetical protein B0H13DRAFT_2458227, partial [Mycena leptocephala]
VAYNYPNPGPGPVLVPPPSPGSYPRSTSFSRTLLHHYYLTIPRDRRRTAVSATRRCTSSYCNHGVRADGQCQDGGTTYGCYTYVQCGAADFGGGACVCAGRGRGGGGDRAGGGEDVGGTSVRYVGLSALDGSFVRERCPSRSRPYRHNLEAGNTGGKAWGTCHNGNRAASDTHLLGHASGMWQLISHPLVKVWDLCTPNPVLWTL